ncbi:Hvo_1808 family surface protein [Natronobeatus ordinarius]|uniref:Hvo_1808 family surface protein n=1 Tax=Natronobeatus ordinarius TaxID=2963433 RepID=UPI0020CBF481|nr:Hvo_1808 family surface protein [Natronobeatus ordinarius]
MKRSSALVLALLVVTSLAAMPLAVAGDGGPSTDVANVHADAPVVTDVTYVGEDDDPSTDGTIGYVEGIRYDDELPIDERDDAVVAEAELEAVVYRSMARVEVIRELTFEEDVPVEVITREEFAAEDAQFGDRSEADRLFEEVRLEALFMVDRETDAIDEFETFYGDAVNGYYDPNADEIVLVSDDLENPELNEVTLGHELLHALQDQHFDLQQYSRDTTNKDHAKLGLIEGDAVWIDTRYEQRCESDWDCVTPQTSPEPPAEFNVGLYLLLIQPYDDGPDYIDALRFDGGWEAVNGVYDEPPTSSSEVIRPGEEREPVAIDLEDTSSDDWEPLERERAPDYDVFGEAAIAAIFMHQTLESPGSIGVEQEAIFDGFTSLNFDHPVTDGWAGDEFVVYTAGETPNEAAFVWQTEWLDEDEAEAFHAGYRELLEHHGAEQVGETTFVIDDGFPGAYDVDHNGETVTIVRSPSVDDLADVRADVDVEALEPADADGDEEDMTDADVGGEETSRADVDGEDASGADDPVPGFGIVVAFATVFGVLFVIVYRD